MVTVAFAAKEGPVWTPSSEELSESIMSPLRPLRQKTGREVMVIVLGREA